MATQPPAPRQWFRLPSIVRGPLPPAPPSPEAPAPQPQPPMVRAPFRPLGMPQPQPQPQPTQPQESTLAPLPAYGVSSVPTSPVRKTSPVRRTSRPSSPVPRTSPPIIVLSATSPPPKPQVSAPSSSQPTSPSLKPLASPQKPPASPMPPSPPKPAPTLFSAPASPPKPALSRFLAPTSPPTPGPTTFSVPTSPLKPAPSRFLPTTSPTKPGPTTFSVPISPPKLAPSTFSPNSPPKPETTVTTTTNRVLSPTPSPRTIKPADKTPPQSPYNKPTAPPPSPLILPPPQLKPKDNLEPTIPAETEQKTVLVQTTSEKPKSWLNGTGNHKDFEETHKRSSHAHHGIVNHEVHKDVAKKEKGHLKKFSSDSDHEMGKRVITIAGENKGAIMEVIKSPMKHSFDGNSHNLHKTESDGTAWKSFSSSSDEGKSKKGKNHKAKAMLSPPMGAFMNSNVQGVNNSIVFHSSCSHHDPGVHLSLSRKPSGNGFQIKDKSNGGHHS